MNKYKQWALQISYACLCVYVYFISQLRSTRSKFIPNTFLITRNRNRNDTLLRIYVYMRVRARYCHEIISPIRISVWFGAQQSNEFQCHRSFPTASFIVLSTSCMHTLADLNIMHNIVILNRLHLVMWAVRLRHACTHPSITTTPTIEVIE